MKIKEYSTEELKRISCERKGKQPTAKAKEAQYELLNRDDYFPISKENLENRWRESINAQI